MNVSCRPKSSFYYAGEHEGSDIFCNVGGHQTDLRYVQFSKLSGTCFLFQFQFGTDLWRAYLHKAYISTDLVIPQITPYYFLPPGTPNH